MIVGNCIISIIYIYMCKKLHTLSTVKSAQDHFGKVEQLEKTEGETWRNICMYIFKDLSPWSGFNEYLIIFLNNKNLLKNKTIIWKLTYKSDVTTSQVELFSLTEASRKKYFERRNFEFFGFHRILGNCISKQNKDRAIFSLYQSILDII